MEESIKDRRRMSQTGLLDSAIRSVSKLTSSSDATTRLFANQALVALMHLRHEFPARRKNDAKLCKR